MKILYGVQATGNGHITRARAMNQAFKKYDVDVDYLFSGRDRSDLFDMEEFGDFSCYNGLTFVTDSGKVKPFATAQQAKPLIFLKDIKNLDLSKYDLVITDFEPISAWAAKKQNIPSIAIGHQNAFDYKIPKKGNNIFTHMVMKYFAPADIRLGLHWHHFNQPILPPIADTAIENSDSIDNKILVYLGFENLDSVIQYLMPFKEYDFFVYSNIKEQEDRGHIKLRPLSRDGFKRDLASCNGVITNAGFELASEAIHLGKKILVKPLKGQMEQLSNALALEKLKLGLSMNSLDSSILTTWLTDFESQQIVYPDVADKIAEWIEDGDWVNSKELADKLWQQTSNMNKHFDAIAI